MAGGGSRRPTWRPAALRLRQAVAGLVVFGLVALACSSPPGAGDGPEELQLAPGLRVERLLERGRPYEAVFHLPSGALLHLAVHQQGVDVVVLLFGPGDRLLFEVDGPHGSRGQEQLQVVAAQAGPHRLQVEPFSPQAEGGFTLEVLDLRPATAEDRVRARAAAAAARADRRLLAGDFEAAAAAYVQALPLLQELQQEEAVTAARWHLGEALLELGRLRQARPLLEEAAAAYRLMKDRLSEARVLNDVGALHRGLGDFARALEAHDRSLELYRELGVPEGQATALNNLGLVHETLGDLEGAADRYRLALSLWRQLDRSASAATTLQNLGRLYSLIGRDDEAIDHLEAAVHTLSAAGHERRYLSALIALGWAYHLAGDSEQALELYDQALGRAAKLHDRQAEAAIFDRQGTALRGRGRTSEAAEAYGRALTRFRQAGSRLSEGHTLANLGWLELETGPESSARERLRQATALLAQAGDPNGEAYARVGLARALRRQEDPAAALCELETALRLVETVRDEVPGRLSRSYFLAVRYDLFEDLVGVLLDLHASTGAAELLDRSLETAEAARARGLLESLPSSVAEASASTAATERRRALLDEIRALDRRRMELVAREPGSPRLPALEQALRTRWLETEHLEAGATSPAAATAREIQALLDDETLLLVYFLAEPESYLWSVDRGRIEVHRLAGRGRIEILAHRTVSLLSRSREVALQGHAGVAVRDLAQALLEPVAERLEGWKRLALVVDGALHYVPFAALPVPGSSVADRPETLLDRHEIVLLPSARVLARQRQVLAPRSSPPGLVAVLADPVFNGDEAAAAALPHDLERTLGELKLDRLQRLPFSGREAEVIAALGPPEQTLVATGLAARRQLVESGVLGDYQILHFATHGLLHPVHPGLSGVVLSLVDEQGRPQDGFLRAHEIAALQLPADLVVLSACQTGLGSAIRGEGLVGLPHAFFQAGARRVVVSHWNVNDLATAELMQRFYQGLLVDGQPAAAALRQAQLSLRDENAWSAPYYWAAFSLQGDWR